MRGTDKRKSVEGEWSGCFRRSKLIEVGTDRSLSMEAPEDPLDPTSKEYMIIHQQHSPSCEIYATYALSRDRKRLLRGIPASASQLRAMHNADDSRLSSYYLNITDQVSLKMEAR
ncbi:hypothetical protein Tco_0933056 [Tanacetum coccineum]